MFKELFVEAMKGDYFNYLSRDYLAIAKIKKSKGQISLTFTDSVGAQNAYDEVTREIANDNKNEYYATIENNVVNVVNVSKGDR